MRKRMFCFLLALSMALLCGCTGEDTTAGTIPDLMHMGEPLPEEELPSYIEQAQQAAEQIPEYTGSPLIPADPDREIYVSLANQDCDYYPEYWFNGIQVFIFTREHYTADQIKITIPMQTGYEVAVNDLTEHCQKTLCNDGVAPISMQNYQYMFLQEVDWHWLGQEERTVTAAAELFGEDILSKEYKAYMHMLDAYSQILEDHQAQYEAMPQDKIPLFSVYDVSIRFTGLGEYEETVEAVEFAVGDEVYPVDIGQWRFHCQLPAELKDGFTSKGLTQNKMAVTSLDGHPYTGELVQVPDALSFTANEDLTVTGVRQINDPIHILGARVIISDDGGNASADFYWDLQQPLKIGAKSSASITLFLEDDCFAQYELRKTAYFIMDYEIDGEAHGMALPCSLSRINNNIWDTYLMAFEGYDIGEYYTCYYMPQYDRWLRELPEEWRQ